MLEFSISRKHDPISNLETSRRSETFQLKSLTQLDIPLIEGNTYVLASWDSNTYIRAEANNRFQVIDQYGSPLELGKNYVLINPCF